MINDDHNAVANRFARQMLCRRTVRQNTHQPGDNVCDSLNPSSTPKLLASVTVRSMTMPLHASFEYVWHLNCLADVFTWGRCSLSPLVETPGRLWLCVQGRRGRSCSSQPWRRVSPLFGSRATATDFGSRLIHTLGYDSSSTRRRDILRRCLGRRPPII